MDHYPFLPRTSPLNVPLLYVYKAEVDLYENNPQGSPLFSSKSDPRKTTLIYKSTLPDVGAEIHGVKGKKWT